MAIGALFAGLGSTIVGGLMSRQQSQQSPDVQQAGVNSAMQGSTSGGAMPTIPAETSGSQAGKLFADAGKTAFATGINSVLNPSKSPTQMGADNKAYMEAAYPELNPWEQAGASATQAGVNAGQMTMQKQMQMNQIQSNERIAKMNNDTTKAVAGVNSQTSRLNTMDTMTPHMKKLPHELNTIVEQLDQLRTAKTSQGKMLNDLTNIITDKFKVDKRLVNGWLSQIGDGINGLSSSGMLKSFQSYMMDKAPGKIADGFLHLLK